MPSSREASVAEGTKPSHGGAREEKTRRSALTVCSYAKNESPISEFESITLAFHEKRGAAVSLRSLERVDRCRRAGTRFRRSCLGGVAVWKTRKKYTTTWFPPQPKRSRTAVDRHSGRTGPRATDTKGTRVRRRVFRVLSSPSRPHAGVGQRRCVRAPYASARPENRSRGTRQVAIGSSRDAVTCAI